MRLFLSLVFLTSLSVANITASYAAEPDTIQKAELNGLVDELNNAAQQKNMGMIANNMPDRLFKEMAVRLKTTEADLKKDLVKQLESQFSALPVGAYHLDASKIEYYQTDKGVAYALVPTRVETKDAVIEYQTLAIMDNTKWHLIYGGQKTIQNPVFQEIYPAFQNVSIPPAKVTRK